MRALLHSDQLRGHTAVVVGAGSSGRAAAALLARLGATTRLVEQNAAAVTADLRRDAAAAGYELREGAQAPADFVGANLVVLSPAVRPVAVKDCLAVCPDAQVVSELELASWFTDIPIVAVTGTNGKTTTVMLVSHLLAATGRAVFTGGNIGTPLAEYVLGEQPADVAVIEASSFQLMFARSFRPRSAVLLNFSPNHLDWHADMAEYLTAKLHIFAAQHPEDSAILPASLRETLAGRRFTRAAVTWFTPTGRFTCNRLPGAHNQENMEAAYLACRPFGVTEDAAKAAFASFVPAPHRLQVIGEKGGVLFVDDSKATTVAAMEAAVKTFGRPVRLLLGGVYKGGDVAALAPLFREKVASVGLFGGAREVFEPALTGVVPVFYEPTLRQAMTRLFADSRPGDVVLLSPATASFDQYDGYKARGRDFQTIFTALPLGDKAADGGAS